jgi:hypothetical protein
VYVVLSICRVEGTRESPESCGQRVQFAQNLGTEAQGSDGTSLLFLELHKPCLDHLVMFLQTRPQGGVSPPFCWHEVCEDLRGWVVESYVGISGVEGCVTSLSSESVKKCNVSIETSSCSYPTLRLTLNSVIFESYVGVVVKD